MIHLRGVIGRGVEFDRIEGTALLLALSVLGSHLRPCIKKPCSYYRIPHRFLDLPPALPVDFKVASCCLAESLR